MSRFWGLVRDSVILQGTLAVMFGGTMCAMYLRGQEVPGELMALMGAIIGFYFGSKVEQRARALARSSYGDD